MLIFPAIDLRGGRVVRLTQGDYDRMTVYADDPVEVAEGFVHLGATCLHAVDLDGAKDGAPQNREVIAALCKLRRFVELGGGTVRTRTTGADRLVKRAEEIGVRKASGGAYSWKPDPADEATVDVIIRWHNGKPIAWGATTDDVMALQNDFGVTREELYEKGAEIVAAFGLTEN